MHPAKIDKARALELKQGGATYREIAKLQGTCHQAIHQAISNLLPSEETETFKANRANIFAEIQRKYIQCIDDAAIKSMIERRGLVDFGILYDKERLERGLNDANVKPLIVVQVNTGQPAIDITPVDNSQAMPVDN